MCQLTSVLPPMQLLAERLVVPPRLLSAHRGVQLLSAVVGYLWGIRTEVGARQAFPLVTGLQPGDCKSIAKASKVRILHLPPRAQRASDQRKRW